MATNSAITFLKNIERFTERIKDNITGQLYFSGLHDTPDEYQDGYFLKSSTTGIEYSQVVENVTELPAEIIDGQLLSLECELYVGCNGEWKSLGSPTVPETETLPGCVTNASEAVAYQEYKDKFLAENMGNTFDQMLNFDKNISDLIYDVCLSSSDSRSEVKIDETTYKWGTFSGTQTVNITATPGTASDGDIVFTHWAGEGAVFDDANSSQTTLLVDKDLLVTGYFVKYATPEPICISPLNKITSPNPTSEEFGAAVAVDGHRMVIGGYSNDSEAPNAGIAYVYELVDRNWTLQATLIAPDAAQEDYFGAGVAIDGDRLMVSAFGDDSYGSIYVYELIMDTNTGEKEWTYQTKIIAPSNAYIDYFGRGAMDLKGDQLVVGDYRYDYDDNGAVFVYGLNPVNGVWTFQQRIDSPRHNLTNGEDYGDNFGHSVSLLDGDRLFIGAPRENTFNNDGTVWQATGAVYLYEKSPGGSWTLQTKLTAPDRKGSDYFGVGVGVDGDRLMIGAHRSISNFSGEVYVYQLVAGEWTYQNTKITPKENVNGFGRALSLDGDRLLIGAPYDVNSDDDYGRAYIYWLNCDPATVEESVNQYWIT